MASLLADAVALDQAGWRYATERLLPCCQPAAQLGQSAATSLLLALLKAAAKALAAGPPSDGDSDLLGCPIDCAAILPAHKLGQLDLNGCKDSQPAAGTETVAEAGAEHGVRPRRHTPVIFLAAAVRSCLPWALAQLAASGAPASLPQLLNAAAMLGTSPSSLGRRLWEALLSARRRGPSLQPPSELRRVSMSQLALVAPFLVQGQAAGPDGVDNVHSFDVTADATFWESLRAGLAHDDNFERKLARHILKMAVARQSSRAGAGAQSEAQKGTLRRWDAFLFLYDMLDEYGIHLFDSAWESQMNVLQPRQGEDCAGHTEPFSTDSGDGIGVPDLAWALLLWRRGLAHDNPQVRRLVLQSFLSQGWTAGSQAVTDFVLGPLLPSLNDPAHHRDFGLHDGRYSSKMCSASADFFRGYTASMDLRGRAGLAEQLANTMAALGPSRCGLCALAMCLEAAASCPTSSPHLSLVPADAAATSSWASSESSHKEQEEARQQAQALLTALRATLELSQRHYNPHSVLHAAVHLIPAPLTSMDALAHFVATLLNIVIDDARVRVDIIKWVNPDGAGPALVTKLREMLDTYLRTPSAAAVSTAELIEEEQSSLEAEALRWATLAGLLCSSDIEVENMLLKARAIHDVMDRADLLHCRSSVPPAKVLLVLRALADLQTGWASRPSSRLLPFVAPISVGTLAWAADKLSTFHWSTGKADVLRMWEQLPVSHTGRLGGPSQRRLPAPAAAAVSAAVCGTFLLSLSILSFASSGAELALAIEVAATYTMWLFHLVESEQKSVPSVCLSSIGFFYHAAVELTAEHEEGGSLSEMRSELRLAGYEALVAVCKVLAATSTSTIAWPWQCLVPLLTISRGPQQPTSSAMPDTTLSTVLEDAIDSLDVVGEEQQLPLLRCLRQLMHWGIMAMQRLVTAAWSAIADNNKRRVAPSAAFLSATLHPSAFGYPELHAQDSSPLKWLLRRILSLATKSPRFMRLTASHFTSLLSLYPNIAPLYVQELVTLCLYGAEAVDEELDGALSRSSAAAAEYAALCKTGDSELTELFTNSEMYARVCVAVMVYDLPTTSQSFGFELLFTLLHKCISDANLNKELYKPYSAIHRRKVRAWQMLSILSRFLTDSTADQVLPLFDTALERANLPSVRQYMEIFGVQVYLRVPRLVTEHLLGKLREHNMKPQVLASYVMIAAHLLTASPASTRVELVKVVLPEVLPSMTSHHHNLRSFTQLPEVTQQGAKKALDSHILHSLFDYLKNNKDCSRLRVSVNAYLDKFDPIEAATPRGMFTTGSEGEQDPFHPAGNPPFECMPVAMYDRVAHFLKARQTGVKIRDNQIFGWQDARESLRKCMAEDSAQLDLEAVTSSAHQASREASPASDVVDKHHAVAGLLLEEPGLSYTWDFQRKIKNPNVGLVSHGSDGSEGDHKSAAPHDDQTDVSSSSQGRQGVIVVASLIDRVPNLAGLARSCEVFKASCLVVSDLRVVKDRHFQQISVTAEQWVPMAEIPEAALIAYLESKKRAGYSLYGLEQTSNSVPLQRHIFQPKSVIVLGREKEGIPVDVIQALDACLEIPQLGIIRSLNVHVSAAIALWEYTRQHLHAAR
eukprot:SM000124S25928  [mRNA]  locus=s124:173056:184239:- [translate_table: standard]